jgi:hypothetical protein
MQIIRTDLRQLPLPVIPPIVRIDQVGDVTDGKGSGNHSIRNDHLELRHDRVSQIEQTQRIKTGIQKRLVAAYIFRINSQLARDDAAHLVFQGRPQDFRMCHIPLPAFPLNLAICVACLNTRSSKANAVYQVPDRFLRLRVGTKAATSSKYAHMIDVSTDAAIAPSPFLYKLFLTGGTVLKWPLRVVLLTVRTSSTSSKLLQEIDQCLLVLRAQRTEPPDDLSRLPAFGF